MFIFIHHEIDLHNFIFKRLVFNIYTYMNIDEYSTLMQSVTKIHYKIYSYTHTTLVETHIALPTIREQEEMNE